MVHRIGELELDRSWRLAIDGVTAAEKTRLAEEMVAMLGEERPVRRLSLDDYHRPAEDRYRRGRYSPQGYYLDTFDYQALLEAPHASKQKQTRSSSSMASSYFGPSSTKPETTASLSR